MPLSKAKDRERKRIIQPVSNLIQPNLILSDGQVLRERPQGDITLWSGWKINAIRNCNRADKMSPLRVGNLGGLKELYDYRR